MVRGGRQHTATMKDPATPETRSPGSVPRAGGLAAVGYQWLYADHVLKAFLWTDRRLSHTLGELVGAYFS